MPIPAGVCAEYYQHVGYFSAPECAANPNGQSYVTCLWGRSGVQASHFGFYVPGGAGLRFLNEQERLDLDTYIASQAFYERLVKSSNLIKSGIFRNEGIKINLYLKPDNLDLQPNMTVGKQKDVYSKYLKFLFIDENFAESLILRKVPGIEEPVVANDRLLVRSLGSK